MEANLVERPHPPLEKMGVLESQPPKPGPWLIGNTKRPRSAVLGLDLISLLPEEPFAVQEVTSTYGPCGLVALDATVIVCSSLR